MKTALSAKVGKKIKEKRLELKLTIHEVSNEINLFPSSSSLTWFFEKGSIMP